MYRFSALLIACAAPALFLACGGDDGDGGPHHPGGSGGRGGTGTLPDTTPIEPLAADRLYVVNGGDATVSVIDTERHEVAGVIRISNASYPHHVYLSSDGARLALALPGMDLSGGHGAHGSTMPGYVMLLNAIDGSTIAAHPTSAMNHNAAFSPNGQEVWTAVGTTPGEVLVLDASSLSEKSRIVVGNGPAEVTFSVSGKHAFVANGTSNSITIIDASDKKVMKTLPVDAGPVGAWQGANGVAYVDNEEAETITAIDTNTLDVQHTYELGFMPGMVALGPDDRLWITDAENGKVVFNMPDMDMRTGELATGAGAHGIAFSGDGKTAYVSNQDADSVSVIDVAAGQIIKTIAVGRKPNGLAWRAK